MYLKDKWKQISKENPEDQINYLKDIVILNEHNNKRLTRAYGFSAFLAIIASMALKYPINVFFILIITLLGIAYYIHILDRYNKIYNKWFK